MLAQMNRLENAARLAMGDHREEHPLPPAPNYGPFGYFRLGILVLAILVGLLFLATLF